MNKTEDIKDIPTDRKLFYLYGQDIVNTFTTDSRYSDIYHKYLEDETEIIEKSIKEVNIESLLATLQHLFAKDMAPVLIFNSNGIECIKLAKSILNYLSNLEQDDLEVRNTNKEIKQMEKKQKRNRDKEFKKRKIKKKIETRDGQVRSMFTNGANNSFEASILEQSIIIPDENRKWKFPCDCKIEEICKDG